ncbi:MAG: metallophosphoesterase family protein [Aeromicrobium sp.]|nr:metallophosphoesterase family protein [Aeromicrobium sp.]
MRRIGLYADVHANLPALEAVLAHMHAEGITERYCLGDLVGYGPHPAEVIARIRALGDPVAQGDHDRSVGERLREPTGGAPTPQETLDAAESFAYTIAAVGSEDSRYLAGLPRTLGLALSDVRVVLCHASPRLVAERIAPDAGGALLTALVRDAGADVVCCGHTHVPFHRSVPTESGVHHWVNVGSVGRPRDGDSRAAWAELVFGTHEEVLARGSADLACRRVAESELWLAVRMHRVAYDVGSVVADMSAAGLPATLAATLTSGSDEVHILAPSCITHRMDRDPAVRSTSGTVAVGAEPRGEAEGGECSRDVKVAAEEHASHFGCEHSCTCVLSDRIEAYECFASIFSAPASRVAAAILRLESAMRSCRHNPHIDDATIAAVHAEAVRALATPDGRAAFEAERERLYGDCRRFDPFSHVLSASELTYLSGDEPMNRAELVTTYTQAGFDPSRFEGACVGHIAVELAFVGHCLRQVGSEGPEGLQTARRFFVAHLADWAVLFAVVTGQQAIEPVNRYAGLALDKYLMCEAATFRTAVPEYCEMRWHGTLPEAP